MNIKLLEEMVNQNLVYKQKHPNADLFIYNYSPIVQYEKLWNEITIMTRGLILDNNYNIIAKPFNKFFNLEEYDFNDIPQNTSFDVYEKMDGSLGILYWLNDKPCIASRGSFNSEQANHATNILYNKYQHTFDKLDRNSTYLFEIIYPQNRIVVDYNDMDDIVLLSIINNHTNEETLKDIGFPIVKKYDGINDINKLKLLEENNKEGFVVKFNNQNNLRIKLKFKEYVRLHKILTNVSNVTIWELLSENKPLDELLDNVPDEFYDWIKNTKNKLNDDFNDIMNECQSNFKILENRKETALYFKTQKYPQVLFTLLDNKSPNKTIWKLIKPKYSKPFKNEQ